MQEKVILISLIFIFFSTTTITESRLIKAQAQHHHHHFVLIHGACHGAWSWYKVATLLNKTGHNVTAIDLAASGVDPRQAKDLKSMSDYFQPLMEFMEGLSSDEKVVIVGHSLGGLAVSKAMEEFPDKISVAVFLSAMMPPPNSNSTCANPSDIQHQFGMDTTYTFNDGPNNPPTTLTLGPLFLGATMYQLSPIEDLTLGRILIRPTRLFTEKDCVKEMVLTQEKYGSVKRVYVMAVDDKAATKETQQMIIDINPPNDVMEINGADHMAMLSQPLKLFIRLRLVAAKYSQYGGCA